jgi:3-deoxy-D-manno-octulosonic-acid transferase
MHEWGLAKNCSISGDTRYDRVLTIAANKKQLPLIESFLNHQPLLIAGSTWPGDEKILQGGLKSLPAPWKLIIAPHEIGADRIADIKALFPKSILYSDLLKNQPDLGEERVLIIDNIGMLSSLYAYGEIAFVGGGFQKGGIHNILEPAVFGLPVLFGPVYKKFVEANELVSLEYAFSISSLSDYNTLLERLITAADKRSDIHSSLQKYIRQKAGATLAILHRIETEKWI